MDVRCERCNTEYEFEDGRVTEEGVTVKCSTCGHLFKIRKKSFVLTEPVVLGKKDEQDAQNRNWMIRKQDGTMLSFKELTTLQKWIVERRVARDDEISKSGETWKKLGTIAELASFFQVVDQAIATESTDPGLAAGAAYAGAPTTPQTPVALGPPSQPPPVPPPPSTQPLPAAVPFVSETQQTLPVASQPPVVSGATLESASQPAASQPGYPAQPVIPQADIPHSVPPVLESSAGPSEPDSWGSEVDYDTDDDVVEKWKKRGRRKWFFIIPILLILAGVGSWYLVAPDSFMEVVDKLFGIKEKIPELAVAKYKSGYAHFLKDSQDELTLAVSDLEGSVTEAKGRYPLAMGTLAEVHVTRADKLESQVGGFDRQIAALDEKVRALMPKDGAQPSDEDKKKIAPIHNQKVELQQKRLRVVDKARKDLEAAKALIDSAMGVDPKSFTPLRAKADYLRVMTGDRNQVEVLLNKARALKPGDPELLFVDAATYARESESLDIAAKMLAQAVDLQKKSGQPELIRARYRLADVLIKLKRPDQAKAELNAILQASPNHQMAKDLLASLAPKKPEPPPPEEKPKTPGQPTSYEGWMALAEKLQMKGSSQRALEAFDAALEIKPNDVEALTGKGLCFLDMGSNQTAINWFKRALKRNRRFGDAIIGVAEAYKYIGNQAEALKYYQRYLDVMPNGPEAPVAQRNVNELK